jgi:hypothetical protein
MYGTPSSLATAPNFSAIINACASLSITQGPAIRNSGAPTPNLIFPIENVCDAAID